MFDQSYHRFDQIERYQHKDGSSNWAYFRVLTVRNDDDNEQEASDRAMAIDANYCF